MKKNSGKGKMIIDEKKIEPIPDVGAMYREGYKGKTKTTRDPKHGIDIITDVKADPYKGISKKSKLEGDVNNVTAFDQKAYAELNE